MIGFSGALFWHGTLTATMSLAPKDQAGLALGAWGAVQATAAGVAMSLSGILRDAVQYMVEGSAPVLGIATAATGYMAVYAVEIALLLITIAATFPLLRRVADGQRSDTRAAGEVAHAEMAIAHPAKHGGDSHR
jgi:BCD family chlorophyll transporter-like MFS transporter